MKIAMIGHKRIPSREGGVEIVVEQLAERMVARGHEVYAYNRKGHHVSGDKENDQKKDAQGRTRRARTQAPRPPKAQNGLPPLGGIPFPKREEGSPGTRNAHATPPSLPGMVSHIIRGDLFSLTTPWNETTREQTGTPP